MLLFPRLRPINNFCGNYRTPAVFFLYMEATFGEEFIVELMNTEHRSFQEAFHEQFELRDTSLVEVFRDFQSWFAAQAPTEMEIKFLPTPAECEGPFTPPRRTPARTRRLGQ